MSHRRRRFVGYGRQHLQQLRFVPGRIVGGGGGRHYLLGGTARPAYGLASCNKNEPRTRSVLGL